MRSVCTVDSNAGGELEVRLRVRIRVRVEKSDFCLTDAITAKDSRHS